ncbi:MAG: flagella basal body P-ring formation protein FlgA [Sphingobium sp.]|nr:flagella basal body P-ring formation protein FlgA [Sphingobium sp.]
MTQNRSIFRLLLAFAALLGAPAFAQQGFESLDKLDSLVAITVGANIGEPGGPVAPIDRRLRLKPCGQTPKVEGPVFSAAIVSCADAGWRIRVPLKLTPAQSTAVPVSTGAAQPRVAAAPAPSTEKVVKKGDPVELIAGSDVFSVSRMMVADQDGAVGDLISVRLDAKSPPVSARVERAGRVRAPTI